MVSINRNIDDYSTYVPVLFARISKKSYNDAIINKGHIYMNTLKHFREIATKGNIEIGDDREGTFPLGSKLLIKNKETNKYEHFLKPYENNTIAINANQCAFCLYGFNDFDRIKNNFTVEYKWEEIKRIMEYYDNEPCSIIIFKNPQKLVTDIVKKINERYAYGYGFIAYDYENCLQPANLEFTPEIDVCFHKRIKYSYQQEYRIVAINTSDKAIDDLFIEPLAEEDYDVYDIKTGCNIRIEIDTEIIESEEQGEFLACKVLGKKSIIFYQLD